MLTLNEKSRIDNSRTECVKDVKIYLYGLKKTCLGVLETDEHERDNKTGLKEGVGIKILTTVLHSRCSLLRLSTYPFHRNRRNK